MDQYIGPNKVVGLVKEEFITPAGNEVVMVQYQGEHPPELMSKKSFDLLVTPAPSDYTDLRARKFEKMLPDIITVLTEFDLKFDEIKPLFEHIAESLQNAFDKANNWLWTHDDRQWVPGMNSLNQRTLLEAEKVLSSMNDGKSKPPSTEKVA